MGNTLAEIAGEKAAIIHDGSRVVVASQQNEARKVIDQKLERFAIVPERTEQVRTDCVSGRTKLITEKAEYEVEKLGLLGKHQIENAKVAILLAEILQDRFAITPQNIIHGLENTRHPGRLEYVGKFLFDGAHNIAGAKALREYLDEFVKQPITMILAAMKDKEIGEIGKILFPKAETLIVTRADNSRSLDPGAIATHVPDGIEAKKLIVTQSVGEALKKAVEITDDSSVILVTGSLYLVGEAKRILRSQI